ncbi:SDR family NAD(P)-dependent oxidoreductase [Actinomadura sp. LD22]|uniref:SDR family NAD(P)-dependent oxidoreductase n=1 Tax=Actinomadura physcomitrii TaxID=2650748 RepID=A0A6I4M660_9ACTN|nr:SDR family NAD(P)-dependent oxidoreductase [Actinomadura physcomitrii]MVZ99636.1 SDR family NAD(P)-dependent oxidoreductase [Actinomadura physcomitrii]
MRDLHGRAAAVTGAGSGIGRALSVRLAREGVRLALADLDEAALAETERALGPGAIVVTHVTDVGDERSSPTPSTSRASPSRPRRSPPGGCRACPTSR